MPAASYAARRSSPATSRSTARYAGMLALQAPAGALVDHGPRRRHRRLRHVLRESWLPLSGRQPRAPPAIRPPRRRGHPDALPADRPSARRIVSTDPDEVRLYCFSEERAREGTRHLRALSPLASKPLSPSGHDRLSRFRAHKRLPQVWQRHTGASKPSILASPPLPDHRHPDETGEKAAAVTWSRQLQDGSMATHPGVYCLRSQRDRLGRRHPVAHLHHAHRRRSRLPRPQVRARCCAPSTTASRCAPDGHLYPHRHCLPTRAGHSLPPARPRRARQLDHLAFRTLEGQQRVTATFRPSRCAASAPSCAPPPTPNPNSAPSTTRFGSRPAAWRGPQDHRLTDPMLPFGTRL